MFNRRLTLAMLSTALLVGSAFGQSGPRLSDDTRGERVRSPGRRLVQQQKRAQAAVRRLSPQTGPRRAISTPRGIQSRSYNRSIVDEPLSGGRREIGFMGSDGRWIKPTDPENTRTSTAKSPEPDAGKQAQIEQLQKQWSDAMDRRNMRFSQQLDNRNNTFSRDLTAANALSGSAYSSAVAEMNQRFESATNQMNADYEKGSKEMDGIQEKINQLRSAE